MCTDGGYVVGSEIAVDSGTAVYAVFAWYVSVEMGDYAVAIHSKGCRPVEHFERTDWAFVVRRDEARVVQLLDVSFHFLDGHSRTLLTDVIASHRMDMS